MRIHKKDQKKTKAAHGKCPQTNVQNCSFGKPIPTSVEVGVTPKIPPFLPKRTALVHMESKVPTSFGSKFSPSHKMSKKDK